MSSEETPVEPPSVSDDTNMLVGSPTTAAAATASVTSAATNSSINSPSSLMQIQLEQTCRQLEDELQVFRENDVRLKQQLCEGQRRERLLTRRLAIKEQEAMDFASQVTELKAAQAPGPAALRSALLDPAVNILFQKLKAELQTTRARLEETQNELSAWKFTPDSNTGKRLMAKCRLLYTENEELGKMTSNGRLAKLEGDLALQKSFSEEVKKSQSELDDFLQELDEDVEGMQSTILFLQQELKAAKDTIAELERQTQTTGVTTDALSRVDPTDGVKQEPHSLSLTNGSSSVGSGYPSRADHEPEHVVSGGVANKIDYQSGGDVVVGGGENHESSERTTNVVAAAATPISGNGAPTTCLNLSMNHKKVNERTTLKQKILSNLNNCNNASQMNGIGEQMAPAVIPSSNNGSVVAVEAVGVLNLAGKNGTNKRNFNESEDEDDSSEDEPLAKAAGQTVKVSAKKVRRSSVLSIDLNEEDSQLVIGHEETTRPGNGTTAGDVGSKA